jgi:hypothetical protein
MTPLEQLETARKAVASYHSMRGYPNEAKVVMSGTCDYSTDVQCCLVAILIKDGMLPGAAAARAFFIPSEVGSESKPLNERSN